MNISLKGFIFLIAILHFYFLCLEMFFWTKPFGQKQFRMTKEYAASTAKLAANQGLYNGFLAAGLIWSTISSNSQFSKELGMFFLSCVVVAGIYGGYSVNRRIFFIQALPALIVLFILLY